MKLKLNEDFCLGCKACEVACLDAHNLPSKAFLQIEEQTKMQEEAVVVTHRLHACLQCEDPRCLQSCPQYA
ncbi:MAG: 4Fe-4S dicluster domain-containing protein, partial [Spirochaetales bacterium]|nr:4Fe-4S dicluster domain-containing protein [Candidatus Physcosoma equi]